MIYGKLPLRGSTLWSLIELNLVLILQSCMRSLYYMEGSEEIIKRAGILV